MERFILFNLLFLFLIQPITTKAWTLPDTGQTQSFTDTFGEDSDYTINPPSYTDNGDGTTTDNVTELMWQQEFDDYYNWYEASGTYDDEFNPDTTDVCGNLSLGGYTDWRLPSKKELVTIVDYEVNSPMIDESYFQLVNGGLYDYWTSTASAINNSEAWKLNFYDSDGRLSDYPKSFNGATRCVRGGQSWSFDNLVISGAGIVTDNNSGLMWQQEDDGTEKEWEEAIEYCEGLSLAGYSDWRLPNIKELESITNDEEYNPSINESYFPNTQSDYYWSSTSFTDLFYTFHAWGVDFYDGHVGISYKSNSNYARCVRGGLSWLLDITPSSYDFGSIDAGSSSNTQSFTISNSGNVNLAIGTIETTGTNATEFTKQNDNCSNTTVSTSSTCTVDVVFSPTSAGSKSASLDIPSNAPDTSTLNVALTGTGTTAQYTLTVLKSGAGSGTVTSSPSGINCGADCSESYSSGTSVTLTASPDSGSAFDSWSGGGCSGTGDCSISIGSNTTVTATFTSCSYNLSSTAQSFTSSGGEGSVNVSANSGCSWSASSNDSWISITSGSSGTGSSTVSYTASENTSTSSRTGTMTIAGHTFTVTQDGTACTYSISPTSRSFDTSGGKGSVTVSASNSTCTWAASTNESWIIITSGSSLTGSGEVKYFVAENTDIKIRTGAMVIADKTFIVTQNGNSEAFALRGYWDFNEGAGTTAGDSSGNAYNGTINGAEWMDNGACGYGLKFKGSEDSVELPYGVLNGLTDTTFSAWVKTTDNVGAIISGANNDDSNEFLLFYETDFLIPIIQGNKFFSTRGISDGQWHYVTMIKDSALSTVHIYIDGVLDNAEIISTGTLEIEPGGLWLGREQDCVGGCFETDQDYKGSMDEVRVFNYVLSEAEILAYMSECEPTGHGGIYSLTVAKSGTGSGIIESTPSGIHCGDDCKEGYDEGTEVTLTATADSGSLFSGWSGGECIGTTGCTVTMDSDKEVTAVFVEGSTTETVPDKAIIVAGTYSTTDSLWESTQKNADKAYKALISQGYAKEKITYLTAGETGIDVDKNGVFDDIDGSATKESIREALFQSSFEEGNILIYFVDHGNDGTFWVNEREVLYAAELDTWLDIIEKRLAGEIIVVYDACMSGSFVNFLLPIQGKRRIVITSTASDEYANFVSQGIVSFSYYFWTEIQHSGDLYDSFVSAEGAVEFSFSEQHPEIDANGNGVSNEKEDIIIAGEYTIGIGTIHGIDVPTIESISDPQTLSGGMTNATITVEGVNSAGTIAEVWAVIDPPNYEPPSPSEPVTNLPTVSLTNRGGGTYSFTYSGYTVTGDYEISVYAKDTDENISEPKTTTITQTRGNELPPAPDINANGSDTSITMASADTLTLSAALDAGSYKGQQAEHWIYIVSQSGSYYYYYDILTRAGRWLPGTEVSYSGNLTGFPSMDILNISGLSPGLYLVYFKVDFNLNGYLDDTLYYDSITITVE